ncbi:MAG: stalk domain-containing protein [Clostridiales bacterium]
MNKKSISVILMTLLITFFVFSPIGYGADISVYINGSKTDFDTPPIIQKGITLVPMRAIFESLGSDVSWNSQNQTITGKKTTTSIKLTIGQKTAYKNNQPLQLDLPPAIINGKTMVPLRFIGESFGCQVVLNSQKQSIQINTSAQAEELYQVVRVIDGDTLIIKYHNKEEKIRLIGVDTPESVHPDANKNVKYGQIASQFSKSHLTGKKISLEMDVQERDKYGRILAYIYLDGKMFNKTLLEQGHAKVATFPPNVKYVDSFLALQKQAQKNKAGIWAYEEIQDQTANPQNSKYIASKSSNKFHYPSCRYAKNISKANQIGFNTPQEAKKQGYTPCDTCKPK